MVIFKINSLLSGLFGNNNNQQQQMEENNAQQSSNNSPPFQYTVDDSFGDEVSIKNPLNAMSSMHHHHNSRRRNSKRFVIGDEGDDVETSTSTPETETLLTLPNPEWLQQSAKLKPGTTLTYVFFSCEGRLVFFLRLSVEVFFLLLWNVRHLRNGDNVEYIIWYVPIKQKNGMGGLVGTSIDGVVKKRRQFARINVLVDVVLLPKLTLF